MALRNEPDLSLSVFQGKVPRQLRAPGLAEVAVEPLSDLKWAQLIQERDVGLNRFCQSQEVLQVVERRGADVFETYVGRSDFPA